MARCFGRVHHDGQLSLLPWFEITKKSGPAIIVDDHFSSRIEPMVAETDLMRIATPITAAPQRVAHVRDENPEGRLLLGFENARRGENFDAGAKSLRRHRLARRRGPLGLV